MFGEIWAQDLHPDRIDGTIELFTDPYGSQLVLAFLQVDEAVVG